ncbi:MAG: cytochrome P450 [Polyangiaceae bacterium]|nr:cytochrome P450 [Polyangiaceae bacterium]
MDLQPLVAKVFPKKTEVPKGLRRPPKLSGGLPVVGHTADFVRDTIGLLKRVNAELGEIGAFDILGKKMVAVFGPDAHEAVFRAPDEQLNPSEAYKIMTPVFGKGMVYDAPPEKMNEQLKMLLPALKDRRMRTYGEIVVREVESTISDWADEGEIDLVDFCRVLTNFTSSHCLLGKEFRTGMTEEFARVYHSLERGVTPIAYLNAHLPLPSFRERDRARIRLEQMVTKIIEERKNSGRVGEDFLQTMMDARYKSGAPLTDFEITGMLIASMFAGHHTSSVTTAWALIELVRNPEQLARVRAELDGLFGSGEEVGFASLRNAPLTEAVVLEALRLHPPLFMLVRVVVKDFVYKDYFLEKGTWVILSPTVSHLIPEYFADPHKFDIDRYLPPREEDKKRDYAFLPFGGGRHKCMGNAFAILQVKAILSILLRRYDFELANHDVKSDFQGLVVGPKEPVRLGYKRRQQPSASRTPEVTTATDGGTADQPATTHKPFKVTLNLDVCQGHAMCQGESPEIFRQIGVGKARLLQATPDPSLRAKAEAAAKYCPTRAIRIEEI